MFLRKTLVLDDYKAHLQSKKWKNVLLLLSDAVVVCTPSKILFANSAFARILEISERRTDLHIKV
jgi:hypothetical protein